MLSRMLWLLSPPSVVGFEWRSVPILPSEASVDQKSDLNRSRAIPPIRFAFVQCACEQRGRPLRHLCLYVADEWRRMPGLGKDPVQDKDNRSVQLTLVIFGPVPDNFAHDANPARCRAARATCRLQVSRQ